MEVKLKQQRFRTELYDLTMEEDVLVFSAGAETTFCVALGELLHFDLDGRGDKLKHFVMETTENVYEGYFLQEGDAEKLLAFLRTNCKCYVDVHLDAETAVP